MAFSTPLSSLFFLLLPLLLPPVYSLSPPSPPSRHLWWNDLAARGGLRGEVGKKEMIAFTRAKEGLDRQGFYAYGPKPHLFVRYSVYRFSPSKIFVIGSSAYSHLDAYPKNQIFSECLWIPGSFENDTIDGQKGRNPAPSVVGSVYTSRSRVHFGHEYEPVVVECEFAEKVGGGSDGLLFLQPAPAPPTDNGNVSLELSIHPMLVFHEKEYDSSIYEAEVPSYKYEYPHCDSALYGTLLSNQVSEWYNYHYELLEKNVHFLVYDAGGMDTVIEDIFRPYVATGNMTINDVRQQSDYDTYLCSQLLFLNDCIHRGRHLSRWVFNFDIDEYLVVRPPQTLKAIVDEAGDNYSISFGTIIYDVRHCLTNRPLVP